MKTVWVSALFILAATAVAGRWDPNWYILAGAIWVGLLVREAVDES